jgi:hypothetical protein
VDRQRERLREHRDQAAHRLLEREHVEVAGAALFDVREVSECHARAVDVVEQGARRDGVIARGGRAEHQQRLGVVIERDAGRLARAGIDDR